MIVYDLDEINDDVLKYIAAYLAFIRTAKDFKKISLKITKLFNIDEFGIFCLKSEGSKDVAVQQIQIIIKTCAKLNVCANAVTNNIEDFTKTDAGRVWWDQSKVKVFLPMGGDMVAKAKKSWGDIYSPGEWQIIESLEKEPQYNRSGVFVVSKNEESSYLGSFYNILTPIRDALNTSSPNQLDFYKKRKNEILKQGKFGPKEVYLLLNEMANEMPFGRTGKT
jgi:type IV secretory pathway VirB4 component